MRTVHLMNCLEDLRVENLAAFICHYILFAFKAEKQESPLDHPVPFLSVLFLPVAEL